MPLSLSDILTFWKIEYDLNSDNASSSLPRGICGWLWWTRIHLLIVVLSGHFWPNRKISTTVLLIESLQKVIFCWKTFCWDVLTNSRNSFRIYCLTWSILSIRSSMKSKWVIDVIEPVTQVCSHSPLTVYSWDLKRLKSIIYNFSTVVNRRYGTIEPLKRFSIDVSDFDFAKNDCNTQNNISTYYLVIDGLICVKLRFKKI